MLWSQEGLERLLHLLGNMEMPLGAYYTNTLPTEGLTPARGGHECIINFIRKSRTQETPVFFCGGYKRLHGRLDVFGIFKRKQG